uniref:Ig-like domain-containing protein n=1 Tax=Cyprinodon variegatus TaxID=28743 RepID=A0A3Q2DSE4_CYPVA
QAYASTFILLLLIKLLIKTELPTVTLQPNWPQIFRGEKVTLRCEIHGNRGAQLKYEWKPDKQNSPTSSEYRINTATESYSGEYSCRARRDYQITDWSDAFRLTVEGEPIVTLQPNWPQIFRGEKVTLRCEIHGGGGAQWTYEWRPTSSNSPTSSEYWINTATESGDRYWCRARGDYHITAWSDVFRLTVRDKPTASLTAGDEIIPLGGSVTLTCSVSSSTGWKFDWFRQKSESSGAQLIRNNEPHGVISISEGGLYSCRAGRGDPVFYTENSSKVTIYKTGEFRSLLLNNKTRQV